MSTATRKDLSSTKPLTDKPDPARFKANAKSLLAALLPLGGVAPARSPRPILGHLRIALSGRKLEASATDLEMWMCVRTQVLETAGEGAFAVPAEAFLQILREAGERAVDVSCRSGGTVLVEAGRDRYEMACLPVDEFPECAEKPKGAEWTMPAGVLPRLLKGTSYAAARERTRYTLNGVYWNADGKTLEVVATDGRRLALARAAAKGQGKGQGILPIRAVAQVLQMAGPLAVALGERAVEIKAQEGDVERSLVTRLLEGQFPDYRAVIPKDYPNVATAPAQELLGAFRRAALLSQESRAVRLVFHKGGISLSGGDPGRGQTKVEADVDYAGGDVDLRVNPDFVMEGLKAWGEEPVRWEIRDSVSPCVLREGNDHLYVVLPITLE